MEKSNPLRSRINRPPAVIRAPRLLIFGFSYLAPKIFEQCKTYWEISTGKDSLYAYVVETDPFMVQCFEPHTSRSDDYRLNDVEFEVLPEDFVRKVKDPQLVTVGRSHVTYVF